MRGHITLFIQTNLRNSSVSKISRRRFTQLLGGASALATTTIVAKNVAADGHSNAVDPESAQAQGLQFVLVSENDNKCSGCLHYTDDGSGEKGPCNIFAGGVVPGEAWCTAFVAG